MEALKFTHTAPASENTLTMEMLEEAKLSISGCNRQTVKNKKKCRTCIKRYKCITADAPKEDLYKHHMNMQSAQTVLVDKKAHHAMHAGDIFFDGSNQAVGVVVDSKGTTATIKIS